MNLLEKKRVYATLIFVMGIQFALAQTSQKFQQRVDVDIEVSLNDQAKSLHGKVTMNYHNNSPDTLHFIYMHLWPNAYSSDRTAYNKQAVENQNTTFYLDEKTNWGFIDSLDFEVNGLSVNLETTEQPDIAILRLNEPILPGITARIASPFRVQIPKTYSRLGHTDESLQISQWYPKPAVYNQDGWHPMPYLDQGEFFSEFGDYKVSITLPADYTVLATGTIETASEIEWLEQKIASRTARDSSFSGKTIPNKTVTFSEKNVHDFAWFADKNWLVEKEEFWIPGNQESTIAYVAYSPEHQEGWKNALEFVKNSTLEYSKEIGNYPYKTVKAIEGRLLAGGGMEYPTITIIIPSNDEATVKEIIYHEVGHNWFYGILANNERREPWLDESLNSFYENKFLKENESNQILEQMMSDHFRRVNMGQAISLTSEDFTGLNYGLEVYRNGAKYFEWLEAIMGSDEFQNAMQAYFSKHRFQHVDAADLANAMQQNSKLDLSWFFEDLINTRHPIDFGIKKIKNKNDGSVITLINKNPTPLPAILVLQGKKNDEENERPIELVATPPFTGKYEMLVNPGFGKIEEAKIHEVIADNNPRNNIYRNGKNVHFRIRPIVALNNTEHHTLALSPALGYNHYDGFMAGILAHNISFPYSKFKYAFAPMSGMKSKNLVGTGFLSYSHFPYASDRVQEVEFLIEGKSFGYETSKLNINKHLSARYYKISPQITFHFLTAKKWKSNAPAPPKIADRRSALNRSLMLKAYFIGEEELNFFQDPTDSLYRPELGAFGHKVFGRILYSHAHNSTFNQYRFEIDLHGNDIFVKASLTANLKVDYHYKRKALYARVFVGKFFDLNQNSLASSRYRLASNHTGWNDYLYDHTYFGRNEQSGMWSKQMTMQEGALKINTLMYANQLGLSSDWLGAINLESDLPFGNLPIRVFADLATFTNARNINPTGAPFLWDAGIQLHLSEILKINVPLLYSKDYKDYIVSIYGRNAFWNTISFTFDIHKIRWSRPLESLNIYSALQ